MQFPLAELSASLATPQVQVSLIVFGGLLALFAGAAFVRYYRSGRRYPKQPVTLIFLVVSSLLSLGTGIFAVLSYP